MNRKQQIDRNRMFGSQLVYDETFSYRNSLLKYLDGKLRATADITYVYQNLLTTAGSQSFAYTGWRGYVSTAITRELTRDL